jgi:N-acetyl-gamma-glutamyl-phosphate reductase
MVKISALTSQSYEGWNISQVFPSLVKNIDLICRSLDIEEISRVTDFIFVALPHQSAMTVVAQFIEKGRKVVDLSADFRLKDPAIYERWYGKHSASKLLQKAVYGLPELYRDKIKKASLVANPGCYPTGIILPLAPLLRNKLIDTRSIIVDAKSGVSGAGRSLNLDTQFVEINEKIEGYKVVEHRHTPEIEQELSVLAGEEITISFVPHLIPINRGILSTIYANLKKEVSTEKLVGVYQNFYRKERFIRIYPVNTFPDLSQVRASNFCDIGLKVDPRTGRVVVISAVDNLVKGGSGQAIQNMNIMEGFSEELGINTVPLFP